MSQFNLTPEEDLLVLGAVRARAAQYLSSMGVVDPALDALVDKIQSQFMSVVESAPAAAKVAEPEAEAEAIEAAETPAEE